MINKVINTFVHYCESNEWVIFISQSDLYVVHRIGLAASSFNVLAYAYVITSDEDVTRF